MPINISQNSIYESYSMLHPDGSLMCHCNSKKAHWYIKRDLAKWLDTKSFQLNFVPQGYGKANDPYYIQSLENKCVVCGIDETQAGLNKHHVVPYVFRSRFPLQYKESNHHDIVPTCVNCHEAYEGHAMQLKIKLAAECGISINSSLSKNEQHNKKIISARKILEKLANNDLSNNKGKPINIPADKLLQINLKAQEELMPGEDKAGGAIWADKIIYKVLKEDSLWDFICLWRRHFIMYAKPQHLPAYWSVEHPLESVDIR